jgi:hypothetical protein
MPNESDTHPESSASADEAAIAPPKPGYVFGLGEILGVLGIIAGLLFVGVEIRANTAGIRGSTYQELTASSSHLLEQMIAYPELNDAAVAWTIGDPYQSLPQDLRTKFDRFLMMFVRHLESAYRQTLEDTVAPEVMERWVNYPLFDSPLFPAWLNGRRNLIDPLFLEYFGELKGLTFDEP